MIKIRLPKPLNLYLSYNMKKAIFTILVSISISSCQKLTVVKVENHTIQSVRATKFWDAVTQRWESKSFAILDDSTEVRISDMQKVGDTIKFIYLK